MSDTPTIWDIGDFGDGPHSDEVQIYDANDGVTVIAGVWPLAEAPDEEQGKNARMISAAPELLRALIEMRNQFDPYNPTTTEAMACDLADKAIDKAGGKDS